MNKLQRIVLMSVLSLLIIPTISYTAPYPAVLKMAATSTSGNTFSLDVAVENIANLYGANIELVFDPAIIQAIGAAEGSFLNSDGMATAFMKNVDNEQGRVIIGISRLGQVSGITGSGTLCSVTFKAKATGTCSLTFQNVSLRDTDLTRLEVNSSSSSADISISFPPAYLRVIPAASTITSGEEFFINLAVEKANDLYGANIDVTFDPAVVQAIAATEGSFLNSDGTQTAFMKYIDNQQGRITLGISRLGQVSGVTGSGTLCSISFKANTSGQTTLRLENVVLKNPDLEKIDTVVTHGTVMVDGISPCGTFTINHNAAYTTTPQVQLTEIACSDNISGVESIRFRNEADTTWSAWQDMVQDRPVDWVLSASEAGGETRTVHMQVQDRAGNTATCTDTILLAIPTGPLDHIVITPGTLTININEAVTFTAIGYDAYNNPIDMDYTWEVTGEAGRVSPERGTTTVFTACQRVDTGGIQVSFQGVSACARVDVIKTVWVSAAEGGLVDSGGHDPGLRLAIAANSLPVDTLITLRKAGLPGFVPGYDLGLGYQLSPAGVEFNPPANLTISYVEQNGIVEPGTVSEKALQIYSCGNSTYTSLNAVTDTQNNLLTTRINALPYAVAILAGSTQARIARLDPASGLAGELIRIEGAGFEKGEMVRIDFGDTAIQSSMVNEFSVFGAVFTVPEVTVGTTTITVTGLNSQRKDQAVFKVVAKESDEWRKPVELPLTPPAVPSATIIATTTAMVDVRVETIPTVKFKEVEVEKNRYQRLSLPGVEQTTVVGRPELPVFTRCVELPGDVKGIRISVCTEDAHLLEATYTVYPAQNPLVDMEMSGQLSEFAIDESVYSSTSWYPAEPASITVVPKILRGHQVLLLQTFPLQYNPVTGQVKVNTSLKVSVMHDTGTITTIEQRLYSEEIEIITRKLMLNYSPPAVVEDKPGVIDGADYLVITNNRLSEALKPLVEWKRKKGLRVRVMEFPDGVAAATIKNELQKVYNTWSPVPKYLLLAGDTDLIPACYQTRHPSVYEGNALIGTDLPYALLDGDDYFPDIFIGRLPVSSIDDLRRIAEKIVAYESKPESGDWLKRIVVAASKERKQWIETSDRIADFFEKKQYTVDKIYGKLDVKGALSNGCLIANHRDHGDSTNGRGEAMVGKFDGWETPRFTVEDIPCVTGSPVFFSMNCRTGRFDGENDCLGEALLKRTGAIAFIGSTRISWTGYNDNMCLGFYEAMWPGFGSSACTTRPLLRTGAVLTYGKLNMYRMQGEGPDTQPSFEEFNLLGDPEMSIWAQPPESFGDIRLTDVSQLIPGSSSLQVRAKEGATICLYKPDDVYLLATASTTGVIPFNLVISSLGTLSVTMSGPGYLPKEELITILAPKTEAEPSVPLTLTIPPAITQGSDFWLDVRVGNEGQQVSDLFGISFRLNCNQGTGIATSTPFVLPDELFGKDVICMANPGTSSVWVTMTKKAGQSGANGYGIVARIRLRLLSDAQQTVTLSNIYANDSQGRTIQFTPTVSMNITPARIPLSMQTAPSHAPGTSFRVELKMGDTDNPADNICGLSCEVEWNNPDMVTSNAITPGEFWGENALCIPQAGKGRISFHIARAGGVATQSSGQVATIEFRVADTATVGTRVQLSINQFEAYTRDNRVVRLTAMPVSFEINGMAVWPGDTNNDGRVDEFDILPIARYWGTRLTTPRDLSSGWEGTTVDASAEAAVYADANGDGIVDAREILVLGRNWGKKHSVTSNLAPQLSGIMEGEHSEYIEMYRAMYRLLKEASGNNEGVIELEDALASLINTGVQQQIPSQNALLQNYPNPFNPETWIPYSLNKQCCVVIKIYNLSGQLIKTLDLGTKDAGIYISRERAAHWDGRNNDGEEVASGIYFCRLHAGDEVYTGKMVVLK